MTRLGAGWAVVLGLSVGVLGCHSEREAAEASRDAVERSSSVPTTAEGSSPSKSGAKEGPTNMDGAAELTSGKVGIDPGGAGAGTPLQAKEGHELAAFAAGCFWGVEDAFRKIPGVTATTVGYAGGHVDAPTYERVCDHDTGHAETVLVEFDPKKIAYEKLLKAFFQIHDPTTVNRQGPDEGDQYRSEIFTFSPAQVMAVKAAINEAQSHEKDPIATKVEPMPRFWIAEDYHQQYAEKTGRHGCPTRKLQGIL
jgi:peptide-methionine (S)-S-oxide reductase